MLYFGTMRTLHTRESGEASHWTMTRREFFATHTDFRNKPGRTGAPMRLALCPKTGATVSVQVLFVCEHNVSEKASCEACDEIDAHEGMDYERMQRECRP